MKKPVYYRLRELAAAARKRAASQTSLRQKWQNEARAKAYETAAKLVAEEKVEQQEMLKEMKRQLGE